MIPRFLLSGFVIFILTSCSGTYLHRAEQMRWHAKRGNFDRALRIAQKKNVPKGDRLLSLLDEATLLQAAGRYEESNRVFMRAEEFVEAQATQVVSKTASVIANDNIIPYHARDFEKPLVDLYQTLNYLALKEPQKALIEMRQIENRYVDYFKNVKKTYLQDPFLKLTEAFVWEVNGKLNDADIDWKWLEKKEIQDPLIRERLLMLCQKLGSLSQCQEWKRKYKEAIPRLLKKNEGELVVLLGSGSVPLKESTEGTNGLQIFPIPTYPSELFDPLPIVIRVDQRETKAYLYHDLAMTVKEALKDEIPEVIARATARFAVKTGSAVALGTQVDEDLGILVGILLLATNRADLRSWSTLPRSFQGAVIALPAGEHDVEIVSADSNTVKRRVEIKSGEKTFFVERFF